MFVRNVKIIQCLFCALSFCLFACYLNVKYLRKLVPGNSRKIENFLKFPPGDGCDPIRRENTARKRQFSKDAWIYGKNINAGYLDHVIKVFDQLGYGIWSDVSSRDWRVLWCHHYPFDDAKFKTAIENMKPHQLVNHIPGSGHYTSKVSLATSQISGVPMAFELPESKTSFLEYAKAHKDKLWVKKNNEHRDIKVGKLSSLNLEKHDTFVQEFIHNPLLVDGRKFDIGVYTVITSVDPLIAYVLNDEVLLRFCSKNYHPFDSEDVEKYVVGDDYTPIWDMPSLKKFYVEYGLNRKKSLNAHIRETSSKNPNEIWDQISSTIANILLSRKKFFAPYLKYYKYPLNFFELSRFDFIVDDQFKVYLMEANMSPNLSSGHFAGNKVLYEQVLFNTLSLLGLANALHWTDVLHGNENIAQIMVPDRELYVKSDLCENKKKCSSCENVLCKACFVCMNEHQKIIFRKSYLEHMNRHSMRRILPSPVKNFNTDNIDEGTAKFLYKNDTLIAWWFKMKCMQDITWCT